jgi:hypothetical protein
LSSSSPSDSTAGRWMMSMAMDLLATRYLE